MHALQAAFTGCFVVALVLVLVQTYWFWNKRANVIIRVRGFWSVLMMVLGLVLTIVGSGLGGGFDLQCIIPASFVYLGVAISAIFLLERSVYLYVSYCIASQAKVFASSEVGVAAAQSPDVLAAQLDDLKSEVKSSFERGVVVYFMKHRKDFEYFSWHKIVSLFLSFGFAGGALALMILYSMDSVGVSFYDPLCQESFSHGFQVILGCLFPAAILRTILHVRLFKVPENYFIKQELDRTAFFHFCILGWTTVASLIYPMLQEGIGMQAYIGITFLLCGVVFPAVLATFSVGLVVIRIYARRLGIASGGGVNPMDARQSIEATPTVLTLDVLLNDAEMCHVFQQFLTKEFSVENLLLWKAIEVFRWKYQSIANQDLSMARATAMKMYKAFCAENARLQVNISAERQRAVEEFFNSDRMLNADDVEFVRECVTMYTELQKDIFDLMKEDSFKRFLKSDEFLQLKADPEISRRILSTPSTTPTNVGFND
jgi:regulator of G-protein signaling